MKMVISIMEFVKQVTFTMKDRADKKIKEDHEEGMKLTKRVSSRISAMPTTISSRTVSENSDKSSNTSNNSPTLNLSNLLSAMSAKKELDLDDDDDDEKKEEESDMGH